MDIYWDAEEMDSPSVAEEMDSPSDAEEIDTSIQEHIYLLADSLKMLRMLTSLKEMQRPKVNSPCPFPKLTGAQWLELNMRDESMCFNNLHMSKDAFLYLHHILHEGFGLESTSQCDSKEALAMFIWTCGHAGAVREAKDRFERSMDTISHKCTLIGEIMLKWSQIVLVPSDPEYKEAHIELLRFAPHFDGCIGAIDGTHIPVEVKRQRKLDRINRKHYASINVCAIVDMHGLFTYVGVGMIGSCHDMRVLDECMRQTRFPTPPKGWYYLADSGYAGRGGYMVPFQGNMLHLDDFDGVPIESLGKEEKFNWCNASLRNLIERRFGTLKEKWHILDGVPFHTILIRFSEEQHQTFFCHNTYGDLGLTRQSLFDEAKEASYYDNCLLCYGQLFVAQRFWTGCEVSFVALGGFEQGHVNFGAKRVDNHDVV